MANRFALLPFLLSTLVLLTSCTDEADAPEPAVNSVETHQVLGVVKTITPSQTYVNIDHEAIPGFMDAMSMFFSVRDSSVLEGISISDSVKFTLEIDGGSVSIIEMVAIRK